MRFEEGLRLGRRDSILERAIENVYQHEAELLKFDEHGLRRLPLRRDLHTANKRAGFSEERTAGIVEKFIIGVRTKSA